ncbi:hypothetical protein Cylst_4372 [Cylindrospermum stagnale PCC 7417]|uniref:Uncharacterized protein n=1 Tax=Cylindrospermum stagnale PCC 7417 TaxID=56107 RepID=K9X461_9NOST|nr:hypothetical protein [Cylindrospermum stagnale]AFZ26462.1 hypothetical protein Cylst_4372 [Cylindrospermum stagnale PCC 7417]
MSDLYDLLQKIKQRPSMYLGKHSIFSFLAFWSGYKVAQDQFGIHPTRQEQEFEEFLQWIREKYEINTSQSWASIILFYSEDERSALDRFFELFEEYLDRDKISESEDKNLGRL